MNRMQNLARWDDPLGERLNGMTRQAWALFTAERVAFEKLLKPLEQTCPEVQPLTFDPASLAPPEE